MSLVNLASISCQKTEPENKLMLIDISGSNAQNAAQTLERVNKVYQQSMPNDLFTIVFFSSAKYLAYTGPKLKKDRDFAPMLNKALGEARKITVKDGTSFEVCKKEIESGNYSKIHVFTDGYFENSELSPINVSQKTMIEFDGLKIENNEKILNLFDNKEQVKVNF